VRIQTSQVRRLAIPVKVWFQRFAFGLLLAAAAALMVLSRAETAFVEHIKMGISDVVAPVLDVISRPVASVTELVDHTRALLDLASENARLREENARLWHWQQTARNLREQNHALRGMLNLVAEPRTSFVTARVITDSRTAFVRTVLVNAGSSDQVQQGQAVINGEGVVGRVVESGDRSARVLLMTDLNSRIPVTVESTRDPAILAGDNSDRPTLRYLPMNATIAPGDRIVTSGQGGMIPPGLPVGIVAEVADGVVRVQPFVRWHRLEYVRVLNFVLPGVLPETRLAAPEDSLR
jgi:rod shape-determining protein MreC